MDNIWSQTEQRICRGNQRPEEHRERWGGEIWCCKEKSLSQHSGALINRLQSIPLQQRPCPWPFLLYQSKVIIDCLETQNRATSIGFRERDGSH